MRNMTPSKTTASSRAALRLVFSQGKKVITYGGTDMSKLRTTLFMVSLLSLVLLSSCTGNRNELPTASAPEAKT